MDKVPHSTHAHARATLITTIMCQALKQAASRGRCIEGVKDEYSIRASSLSVGVEKLCLAFSDRAEREKARGAATPLADGSRLKVDVGRGMKEEVLVNPNTTMGDVLEQGKRCNAESRREHPKHQRKLCDRALTVRFAGLSANAMLELVSARAAACAECTIALQLEGGARLPPVKLHTATTLADVLAGHMPPSPSSAVPGAAWTVVYLGRPVPGPSLATTTLLSLGIAKGASALLRVSADASGGGGGRARDRRVGGSTGCTADGDADADDAGWRCRRRGAPAAVPAPASGQGSSAPLPQSVPRPEAAAAAASDVVARPCCLPRRGDGGGGVWRWWRRRCRRCARAVRRRPPRVAAAAAAAAQVVAASSASAALLQKYGQHLGEGRDALAPCHQGEQRAL